jgi:hypothetical protein
MLAALSFEVSWSVVTAVFAALGVIATGLAVMGFKVYQKWKSLSDTSAQDALVKREKLTKEEAELRETLLGRYKDLYDLTRNESTRDLKIAQEKMDRIVIGLKEADDKIKSAKLEVERFIDENKKLLMLNLEFQTSKSQDAIQIRELSETINRMKADSKRNAS